MNMKNLKIDYGNLRTSKFESIVSITSLALLAAITIRILGSIVFSVV